jgi:hypothetical protein
MTPGPGGYRAVAKLKVTLLFVLRARKGLRAVLRRVSHIGHTRLSEARSLRGQGVFFALTATTAGDANPARPLSLLGGGQMVDPFCAEARVAVAE